MSRAIVSAWHKYTPFGGEFYEPLLDFFIETMKKYKDEYDMLYLMDSTWNIDPKRLEGLNFKIIKVNPSLRYYDGYKEVLPQVEEDLVLFMDNDMVVYRKGIIEKAFDEIDIGSTYDIASIYDTIGDYKTDKMNDKNKFCPYWFAMPKELLLKYLNVEWAPDMPYCETLGHLTEALLNDEAEAFEFEEDKSNILFDGSKDGEKSKDLGYYHIRAGATPSYLLATKFYGDYKTYEDYMVNQPKSEYLRQFAWYYLMTDTNQETWILRPKIWELLKNIHIDEFTWMDYYDKFLKYHGLI